MEIKKKISVLEVIKYGFVTFFEHIGLIATAIVVDKLAVLGFLLAVLFVSAVIGGLPFLVAPTVVIHHSVRLLAMGLLGFSIILFSVGIGLGFIRIFLDLSAEDDSSLSLDCFLVFDYLFEDLLLIFSMPLLLLGD